MYLPVFKADKGGEWVWESLGSGTGFAPTRAWGGKCPFLGLHCVRASLGFILCEEKELFLAFGGQ